MGTYRPARRPMAVLGRAPALLSCSALVVLRTCWLVWRGSFRWSMALLGVFQCRASLQSCVAVVCHPARRSMVDFGRACALLCFSAGASCSWFAGLWWIGVVPWCCVALCLGVVLLCFLVSFVDLKWHLNMWCRAALWIRAVLLCLDVAFVDLWRILDAASAVSGYVVVHCRPLRRSVVDWAVLFCAMLLYASGFCCSVMTSPPSACDGSWTSICAAAAVSGVVVLHCRLLRRFVVDRGVLLCSFWFAVFYRGVRNH
ncbi:hypothetical protein GOP47_0009338 [Adiantum capillus-veneris]|uniref:Uncharacterized protein n=1 Tax=Adiantum capillus-veneris TaxID=13818 RepID=A0A9D4ZIL4_ADICA|nr:hypothetical protein GOP47_0009338 [Adiantum capillus-veneris]